MCMRRRPHRRDETNAGPVVNAQRCLRRTACLSQEHHPSDRSPPAETLRRSPLRDATLGGTVGRVTSQSGGPGASRRAERTEGRDVVAILYYVATMPPERASAGGHRLNTATGDHRDQSCKRFCASGGTGSVAPNATMTPEGARRHRQRDLKRKESSLAGPARVNGTTSRRVRVA